MALEQSQNKDSEVKGGLSEIADKDETQERWTLTAHLLAAVVGNSRAQLNLKTLHIQELRKIKRK